MFSSDDIILYIYVVLARILAECSEYYGGGEPMIDDIDSSRLLLIAIVFRQSRTMKFLATSTLPLVRSVLA